MIVFNKGSQTITYSGGAFTPGSKPVEVDTKHEAEVEKLLKRYPQTLVEADASTKVAMTKLADLETENRTLKAKLAESLSRNAKLTQLLEATPEPAAQPEAAEDAPAHVAPPAAEEAPAPAAPRKSSGKRVI